MKEFSQPTNPTEDDLSRKEGLWRKTFYLFLINETTVKLGTKSSFYFELKSSHGYFKYDIQKTLRVEFE